MIFDPFFPFYGFVIIVTAQVLNLGFLTEESQLTMLQFQQTGYMITLDGGYIKMLVVVSQMWVFPQINLKIMVMDALAKIQENTLHVNKVNDN